MWEDDPLFRGVAAGLLLLLLVIFLTAGTVGLILFVRSL